MKTMPIEEVFETMGIEWCVGTKKEVRNSIELFKKAFAEIGLYPKLLSEYKTRYNQDFYKNNNDAAFVKPNNQSLTDYSVEDNKANVSYVPSLNDGILFKNNIVA